MASISQINLKSGIRFRGQFMIACWATHHPVYYRSGNSFANTIRLSPEQNKGLGA
jgi:hypothetical protein